MFDLGRRGRLGDTLRTPTTIGIAFVTIAWLLLVFLGREGADETMAPSATDTRLNRDAPKDPSQTSEKSGSGTINPFANTADSAFSETLGRTSATGDILIQGVNDKTTSPSGLLQPMVPELPPEEIERLHEDQLREWARSSADPNRLVDLPPSDDPPPTLTEGELDLLHAHQEAVFRTRYESDGVFELPGSADGGVTVSVDELSARHQEEERAAREMNDWDPLRLPASSDDEQTASMTEGGLSRLHDEQTAEALHRSRQSHHSLTLPPSADSQHGITFGELDRLHFEQSKGGR